MRPASTRSLTLGIGFICLIAMLCSFEGLAAGQSSAISKRKLSHRSPIISSSVAGAISARSETRSAPPPVTTDTWTGAGSNANWSNASNWNNGAITTGENILINLTSAATTADQSFSIGTLTLSNTGDLVTVANNTTLTVAGNVSNAGTITLNSIGNGTSLELGGNVTLSGTGTVTLSNNSQNYIFGANALDQLTNQQTIQGAGHIGNGQMALVNSGTINANQSAGMTIDANDGLTNTGTIEATAGATLALTSMGTVNNTGGTISASGGGSIVQVNSSTVNGGTVGVTGAATLQLNTGTIRGGTLTNSSTGTIEIETGSNVLGGTINNSAGGLLKIDNNSALYLQGGTYAQLGAVQLNSVGNGTSLILAGNVTLSGGSVTLSNNAQNYIYGQTYTDTLTNQETISGAGHIGNNTMTLVNGGTINSNGSAGMTIQANGGVTNTGTIEATSGSTLAFSSTGVVNNTGGTITANTGIVQVNSSTVNGGTVTVAGASTLQLNTGAIHGGTLSNSSTGTIEIETGSNWLGGTINNSAGGLLKIDNNSALYLDGGSYAQLGAVQLNSVGNGTSLILAGNVTLSGGTVTLSNNSQNYIYGQTYTDTLTNQETISGAGHIGNNTMTLVNAGTINSNGSGGMTIQANGGVTNTGTIEATSGSTLTFSSTGVVSNAGGTITANTGILQVNSSTISGGTVSLAGASTLQLNTGGIHGGTLTNSSTGTIEIASGFDWLGGTINNSAGGLLKIDNNSTLNLDGGVYAQLGAVQLNSVGNGTGLQLEGNVTLTGGSVTLSNNSQNYIYGQTYTDTLTNQETISGAGHIGNNTMTLVNAGTINSNGSGGMTIQANGGVTNTGTLEATGGAILTFSSTGVVNNTGGNITANTGTLQVNSSTVNGGTVSLVGASLLQLNSGAIQGGTLTNSSSGTIEIASGTSWLGGTINNSAGGLLKVDNNTALNLAGGTYSQLGTVQLNSVGNGTSIVLQGNVTLSGGTVTLSANSQNYILGANSFDILTNQDTIQGAGNIGNGGMGVVNSGTILANASGNLVINVSNSNFNNTGTVEASGATLTIQGPGVNFFTNDNESTATLTGGTYIASGSNIQWAAGANGITTLAAKVTEQNGGQIFNTTNSTNALAGLTSITSAGSLTIGSIAFTDAGSFSNAGSLTLLPGESFTVGSLSQISSGSLTAGTYVLDANLNLSGTAQTIITNAATLTLAGGTIENTSNTTNALAGLATNSGRLTIGGGSNNVSTTASSFSNTGTLTIDGGDSFTASKLTQISGTTLSAGTLVLVGNLDLTTAGITIAKNSATLTLQGGTINSNGVNALNALSSNTKSLTLAGNANLTTASAGFSNSGTVVVSSGTTLTVPGAGSYTQTAGQTTIDGSLAGISGGAKVTGGSVLGSGTIGGNLTAGNATGAAVTINVGDTGLAGLLSITGTYTQLATGNMTGLINGTTAGSGFSQLAVTGSAALAGTINITVASAFQSSLTLNETFTVLTASSVTGTFSNSTIAINSSFHFIVSYTSTGVVLTVASGPVTPGSSPVQTLVSTANAGLKPTATITAKGRTPVISGPHGVSGAIKAKPIMVASWAQPSQRSNAIAARGSALLSASGIWEHATAAPASVRRPIAVATPSRALAVNSTRAALPVSNVRLGRSQAIGVQLPHMGWMGTVVNRGIPARTLSPMLPRIVR